jgi:hypothetical protein
MSALPGLAFGLEPAYAGNVVGRLEERSDGAGIERHDASTIHPRHRSDNAGSALRA